MPSSEWTMDQAQPSHKVFWRTPAEHLSGATGGSVAKRCSPGVLGNTWPVNVCVLAPLIGWTARGQAVTVRDVVTRSEGIPMPAIIRAIDVGHKNVKWVLDTDR